jgi:hypothetical protein
LNLYPGAEQDRQTHSRHKPPDREHHLCVPGTFARRLRRHFVIGLKEPHVNAGRHDSDLPWFYPVLLDKKPLKGHRHHDDALSSLIHGLLYPPPDAVLDPSAYSIVPTFDCLVLICPGTVEMHDHREMAGAANPL